METQRRWLALLFRELGMRARHVLRSARLDLRGSFLALFALLAVPIFLGSQFVEIVDRRKLWLLRHLPWLVWGGATLIGVFAFRDSIRIASRQQEIFARGWTSALPNDDAAREAWVVARTVGWMLLPLLLGSSFYGIAIARVLDRVDYGLASAGVVLFFGLTVSTIGARQPRRGKPQTAEYLEPRIAAVNGRHVPWLLRTFVPPLSKLGSGRRHGLPIPHLANVIFSPQKFSGLDRAAEFVVVTGVSFVLTGLAVGLLWTSDRSWLAAALVSASAVLSLHATLPTLGRARFLLRPLPVAWPRFLWELIALMLAALVPVAVPLAVAAVVAPKPTALVVAAAASTLVLWSLLWIPLLVRIPDHDRIRGLLFGLILLVSGTLAMTAPPYTLLILPLTGLLLLRSAARAWFDLDVMT